MKNLYQISTEIKNRIDEFLSKDEVNFLDTTLFNELQKKSDDCMTYFEQINDLEELISQKISNLTSYKKSLKAKKERFEDYIISCMKMLEVDEIKGSLYKIGTRKPTKKCVVYDEKAVPSEFKTVEQIVKVDKKALADRMKMGEIIDGANLQPGKTSLIIKKLTN